MAIYESNTPAASTGTSFSTATTWYAQTFTPTVAHAITSVQLRLWRLGSGCSFIVSIRGISGGDIVTPDLTVSPSISCASITTSAPGEWVTFPFPAYNLTAGTMYAIVVRRADSSGPNQVAWNAENNGAYTTGTHRTNINSGANGSWTIVSTNRDTGFRDIGIASLIYSTVEKKYSKKLVAINSNELWYESSAGTMAILSASAGGVDGSTDRISIVEAFQKVFIANGTNIKVADFGNIKLHTTSIGATVPTKGMILIGKTSTAQMVLDFITASSGDTYVYGQRISTTTFASGEEVWDGGTVSFVLDAAEVSAPHWYTWDVYGANDTTYGLSTTQGLPTKANLVCLYRGHLVLSGNPQLPHQWYMSRVGDPWDFHYTVNDALTAVAGNNTDAGEIGDIIEALIPYGDDYLVFGCAGSMWVLRGDAASGGSIDPITETEGIFGSKSWCWDSEGNLWYFGTKGLSMIPAGFGKPVNISESRLPKLLSSWALDKSTHLITMGYDPVRNVIHICKTTLASGVNENYCYDLKVKGFFPETYPDSCGVSSIHFYQATNQTYTKLLFGCFDGYLREFSDSYKNDDTTASTSAINSYVVCPIIQLGDGVDKEGRVNSITMNVSGGASIGGFTDADRVTYSLYTGNSAELVLEDIIDGATPQLTAELTTVGRQNRIRTKLRGAYLGLKLSDSTASATWAMEKITLMNDIVGRIR